MLCKEHNVYISIKEVPETFISKRYKLCVVAQACNPRRGDPEFQVSFCYTVNSGHPGLQEILSQTNMSQNEDQ